MSDWPQEVRNLVTISEEKSPNRFCTIFRTHTTSCHVGVSDLEYSKAVDQGVFYRSCKEGLLYDHFDRFYGGIQNDLQYLLHYLNMIDVPPSDPYFVKAVEKVTAMRADIGSIHRKPQGV